MSWNDVFLKGIEFWFIKYSTIGQNYYIEERDLRKSLEKCFEEAAQEIGLPLQEIKKEVNIVGKTRVDFLIGNQVAFEVKFEPDYPGMPDSRKPVTNAVLKRPDSQVANYLGMTKLETQMRLYEVELDLLKLIALKKRGIPYNYLFCLDEDGRLHRNLTNSFKTNYFRQILIPWKTIHRGKDNQKAHYFLWQAETHK